MRDGERGSMGIEFVWVLVIVGAVIAGGMLAMTFMSSMSAPQEAAGAAMAVGCVVIPYCFARAVTEIAKSNKEKP